jgi:branched-chain amino acid transport system ATP-binding protein
MTRWLLDASGITTGYGRSQVLRDVSLRVAAGEVVGLLGRNGMGKTTLLRTIMGLLSPGPGGIRFDGRDLSGAPCSSVSRAGIALVPEGRGIFPNLTLEEQLTLAARGKEWTLERVYTLFPRLAERRRNFGDQLSGGEQQMLAIGRALMTNPKLIMLDEATEGLAPAVRDQIWATLRTVRAANVALVVVDKNLKDLFALAERCIVLAKGEMVFEGATTQLRDDSAAIRRWLGV